MRASKSMRKSSLVKPPGTGERSGSGLITATWPASASAARAAPVPYAESPRTRTGGVFTLEQAQPDDGLVVVRAAGLGQRAIGDDSGVGLDGKVGFEAVLAAVHRLVSVPRVGIDGGDHAIPTDLLRDAPVPVGAIRALDRFNVLTGDQRQQRHRLSSPRREFLVRQIAQHPVSITDQTIHQPIPSGLILPRNRGFPRIVVIMGAAVGFDHRCSARDFAAHSSDRGDQLRHGVLRGHRIVEHRGIQGPPCLARQHPGLGHHRLDRLKDPVGPIRSRQPTPPIRQRRRMKRARRDRQPARCFPAQIESHRIHGLVIRKTVQGLQGDHRGHHLSRHAGPAPLRREQVREHLLGKQLAAVRRQERKHAVGLQKMPGNRLRIQQLTLIIRATLHPTIIPKTPGQLVPPRGINSAGS
ncbi:hypothetical protein B0172_03318 [Mycobacterium avium subsp. paratuberculosis]|nr:hypothetical protein B0172_03608 [Mycobacterium avium subsp. paratuberculosis]OUZ02508.1 hypothetical protein B0172_03318 [Mycobacterium avium subsp. paratuberculosis]OVF06270.1 hypothetical protein B0173_00005 [Mycobacterium avium subsp. paratuberculosis]QKU46979.1 hypothetical protein MAP44135_3663 [Mycobacterium avium subsp. paratuberculosis]CAG7026110.1 hypothetical protein PICSAR16_04558 [Mycobacterium avium subsp. paratuberculosis]